MHSAGGVAWCLHSGARFHVFVSLVEQVVNMLSVDVHDPGTIMNCIEFYRSKRRWRTSPGNISFAVGL